MRTIIYIIAIANVIMGFFMLFMENSPFKGKTYRDIAENSVFFHIISFTKGPYYCIMRY